MKHAWVVILFVLASLLARPLLAQTGDDETPPTLCVDIHDKTRAGSLAFIEMKRWIPYIFDELMGNRLQITGSRSVTVDFGIDADKQPTNIHISQSSGHAIVDQLAIDAVKRAAPYRESGGCFKITLTYTYQADKPGSGTVGESESIGQGSNTLNGMTFRVNDHVPNQVMELGAGDDTYSFPTTVTGQDFIDDTSGKADALIFGQKKLTEAQLQAQDGPDPDANIDCLWINFGSGNSITIYHYFDNSTRSLADIKPGNGLLETIAFQWDDKTLCFEDVKAQLKEGDIGRAYPKPLRESMISLSAPRVWRGPNGLSTLMSSPRPNQARPMVPSLKPPSQQPRTGVNTSAEPDFGPYVAELQRRIKRNWIPPSGTENKRIVAKFKIARDGRLVSVILSQPSGNALADAAALAAIRAAAPFRPLPTAFKKNDIEIQFIFDYNVFQNAKPIPGLSPKPRNTVDI